MDTMNDSLCISGMTYLEISDLRQALTKAGLNPEEILSTRSVDLGTPKFGEPGTIMVVIEFAKVVVPAVASVLAAYLTGIAVNDKPKLRAKNSRMKKRRVLAVERSGATAKSPKFEDVVEEDAEKTKSNLICLACS